jgi:acetyltransferase-like isoleucine patch superfamily enzyme
LRNLVRFGLRPAWLRVRLGWTAWGNRASARIGRGLSLGRGVQIFLLPGSELVLADRVRLCDGVVLVAREGARLEIGEGTYVGPRSELHAAAAVTVGASCLLAGDCLVIDHDHAFDLVGPVREKELVSRPIVVGDGTWLATRVLVAAGSTIGPSSVIAGGASVTGDIPSGSLAGGVPARILRSAGEKAAD